MLEKTFLNISIATHMALHALNATINPDVNAVVITTTSLIAQKIKTNQPNALYAEARTQLITKVAPFTNTLLRHANNHLLTPGAKYPKFSKTYLLIGIPKIQYIGISPTTTK